MQKSIFRISKSEDHGSRKIENNDKNKIKNNNNNYNNNKKKNNKKCRTTHMAPIHSSLISYNFHQVSNSDV